MLSKFDARTAVELIEKYRITSTYMPPVLIKRLISLPREFIASHDTSSLKAVLCGGAPCPQSVRL